MITYDVERSSLYSGMTATELRSIPVTPGEVVDDVETTLVENGREVARYYPGMASGILSPADIRQVRFGGSGAVTVSNRRSPNGVISGGGARLSGILAPSETFGMTQPVPARRRYSASPAKANRRYPAVYKKLMNVAATVVDRAGEDVQLGDADGAIFPIWKPFGGVWTSAILNGPRASYPFHRDSGNLQGSWSAMIVVRGGMSSGGFLTLPELGVSLPCSDGSICIFPGGSLIHGVTRIIGFRSSTVFYCKRNFVAAAETFEEELERGNLARSEYETRGAGL